MQTSPIRELEKNSAYLDLFSCFDDKLVPLEVQRRKKMISFKVERRQTAQAGN